MKIIYGLKRIKKFKKTILTIGVFDGVHRAHRVILRSLVARAHRLKATSVVLSFFPHPQKEQSLYSLEHRLRLIEELGIDVCIVVNFNKNFANITAFNFVRDILIKKLGAKEIYVGNNFRFGRDGLGDIRTLKILAQIFNFRLKVFDVLRSHSQPISSTYIRTLIKRGDLNSAKKLLLSPVAVLGTVRRGIHLGRRLGFPTANINPHHEIIPPAGIYAVRIIYNKRNFLGACYIGTRPTLEKKPKKTYIEVYIFGLNKNIYGEDLEIQFIKKLRDDKRFNSLTELAQQMEKDIQGAKRLFSLHSDLPQYMPIKMTSYH